MIDCLHEWVDTGFAKTYCKICDMDGYVSASGITPTKGVCTLVSHPDTQSYVLAVDGCDTCQVTFGAVGLFMRKVGATDYRDPRMQAFLRVYADVWAKDRLEDHFRNVEKMNSRLIALGLPAI